MLKDLVVEELGVIERAELSLEPGCSVLTGETGAGKTLLVAALSLLIGGRADRSLVRTGSPEARVQGRFVVPRGHPVTDLLTEEGVINAPATDDALELVFVREVAADGKGGKARINGRLVPVATLERAGRLLVEIAGQHEHHRLASPSAQRAVLDAFAGPDAVMLAAGVADAVRAAAGARRRLEEIRRELERGTKDVEAARYETEEIARVQLDPGELERLEAQARRLEHASSLAEAIESGLSELRSDAGAIEVIARAERAVADAAAFDGDLGAIAARLGSAGIELDDIAAELARCRVEPDPVALEEVRDRIGAITRVTRRYGGSETGAIEYLVDAQGRIAEIESTELEAQEQERIAAATDKRAGELADRLSLKRAEAAPRLALAVEGVLAELALADATLRVELARRELHEGGNESIELLAAMDRGEQARPVAKIASGGELARTALALRLLTASTSVRTMVFDEVDAGVGGRAAQAVGRRLAELAERSGAQVLVVTHLPQVAAFGDTHYVVTKEGSKRARAVVDRVEGRARVEELSRMLAGLPESDRAREHAQELLDLAAAR